MPVPEEPEPTQFVANSDIEKLKKKISAAKFTGQKMTAVLELVTQKRGKAKLTALQIQEILGSFAFSSDQKEVLVQLYPLCARDDRDKFNEILEKYFSGNELNDVKAKLK